MDGMMPVVTPELVREAVGALVAVVAPGGKVLDAESFAALAGVRDGLLAVVCELDVELANYAHRVHDLHPTPPRSYGRGEASDEDREYEHATSGCYVCELQRGDKVGTTTVRKRWSR